MLKSALYGLAAFAVLSFCAAAAPQKNADKDKKDEASIWMQRKLDHSQKVLSGLTKGDFAMIEKGAESLRLISYLAKSDHADLPEYKRQVRYFDDANKELIRQARAKNLNGATLAYTQLMLSCVHCHTIMRTNKK